MPASVKLTGTHLLDTSAILAYLLNEPQAGRVSSIHSISCLPFIVLAELYAALWIKFNQPTADIAIATLRQWKRPWLWPTDTTLLLAGRLRAIHRLGLADSLIASLAIAHQLILVTKDHDFRPLEPELTLLFLG